MATADAIPPASQSGEQPEAAEAAPAAGPTEEEEEKVPYEIVETKALEGSAWQYKVSVPREVFDKRTEHLYRDLSSSVTIEGFRRGKAPRRLLEIRYGKEVTEDAVKDLGAKVTDQIIASEKLEVIGDPDLKEWKAEKGNPVELIIEVEVQPKVTVTGYEGLEVEVEEWQATEEMVEQELERLRQATAQFKTAPAGAKFNPGDGAVVDYEVRDAHGARLERQCSTDAFEADLAARLPRELASQIVGLEPGQTVTCEIESAHRTRRGEERRTKDTHTLTLKEIKIRELPEVDDDFAKDLGEFDSLEALKGHIRQTLQAQIESRTREEIARAIYDRILAINPIEAPKTVVAASALNLVGGTARTLASAGVSLEDFDSATQQRYLESTRAQAERQVKVEFAVQAIAEEQKLAVTDEDVERAIGRMAEREGRRPLAIRARLERERRLDRLRSELLVEKVSEYLISKARVKKAPAKVAPVEAPAGADRGLPSATGEEQRQGV